ncbi:MAG: hypothetical protein OXU64_13300 [Gemmatimonadota bacterium]|nr:hypothetical protein [Gemmatimonadota bacterium]
MRKTIAGVALAAVAATTSACTGAASTWCMMFGPWGDEMPDLVMMAGDTVETSLLDHFSPRECLEEFQAEYGGFAARSSEPAAVAVSVSEYVLTTIAIAAADTVLVNVGPESMIDHGGCIRQSGSRCHSDYRYNHNFYVSVRGPPPR